MLICAAMPCLTLCPMLYRLLSSAPPHAATATTEHRLLPRRRVRAWLPLLVPPLQHPTASTNLNCAGYFCWMPPQVCTRVWCSVGGWSSWRSLLPLPQQERTISGCLAPASLDTRLPLCPPPQPNDIPDAPPSIPARAKTNASSEGTACFDVQPNGRCQLLELHCAALALGIVCKVQHAGATASAPHSQVYQAYLPSPRPDAACADGTTCAQKQSWGQCSASWMLQSGWCAATCGRCTPAHHTAAACADLQPPGGYTCAQQAAWGKVLGPPGCCLLLQLQLQLGRGSCAGAGLHRLQLGRGSCAGAGLHQLQSASWMFASPTPGRCSAPSPSSRPAATAPSPAAGAARWSRRLAQRPPPSLPVTTCRLSTASPARCASSWLRLLSKWHAAAPLP